MRPSNVGGNRNYGGEVGIATDAQRRKTGFGDGAPTLLAFLPFNRCIAPLPSGLNGRGSEPTR